MGRRDRAYVTQRGGGAKTVGAWRRKTEEVTRKGRRVGRGREWAVVQDDEGMGVGRRRDKGSRYAEWHAYGAEDSEVQERSGSKGSALSQAVRRGRRAAAAAWSGACRDPESTSDRLQLGDGRRRFTEAADFVDAEDVTDDATEGTNSAPGAHCSVVLLPDSVEAHAVVLRHTVATPDVRGPGCQNPELALTDRGCISKTEKRLSQRVHTWQYDHEHPPYFFGSTRRCSLDAYRACAIKEGVHGVAGGCCVVDFPCSSAVKVDVRALGPRAAPVMVYTPDGPSEETAFGFGLFNLVFSLLPKQIQ
ncbi:hypothetical protein C8J57DRAFT_1611403 [Mycena rebaudengoi]|nr:hypothetical protein C8J57DRAFT_1611403 [Mycena rebaudengoi]